MGNCLKSPTSDDISLLHESQSDRASYGDGADPDQEPPPPYQEQIHVPVYHPTPSQTRLVTQLTEEEQIRIAQRIGLIQHLPKGVSVCVFFVFYLFCCFLCSCAVQPMCNAKLFKG
uniref:Ring finger protein 11 n=1 Tax=Neolamprologus brichardi TaxID=32507 RepID=A0A3Q4H6P0_NEOBR